MIGRGHGIPAEEVIDFGAGKRCDFVAGRVVKVNDVLVHNHDDAALGAENRLGPERTPRLQFDIAGNLLAGHVPDCGVVFRNRDQPIIAQKMQILHAIRVFQFRPGLSFGGIEDGDFVAIDKAAQPAKYLPLGDKANGFSISNLPAIVPTLLPSARLQS